MVEQFQAYVAWRHTESKAREAADAFAAAIQAGRHPSEAELGELSRLRTAAAAALHDMIERAQRPSQRTAEDGAECPPVSE
jgi:hypothetical protein